ncbi:MAG: DsrE/DsrF/DrsH-like family protein [Candidatus Korarchaeota archaeon]|nr:DsrE/DsrF/DrsH-like family protein [Candidatus Korarchaeota archaeon]
MSEGAKRVAIIVSKNTLDMAYPPLILAVTAAAMGMEVYLFFTFWGMYLLEKGGAKKAKLPGIMRLFTGMMEGKMQKVGVPPLEEMMKQAKEMGVKFYACQTTMDVLGVMREDLWEGVDDVVGAATFMNIAKDADVTLFI